MLNPNHQQALQRCLPKANQLLTSPAECMAYQRDANFMAEGTPAAIALPDTTAQVAALVRACVAHNLPYTARGAGTGQSGGAVASAPNTLLISFARMANLLALQPHHRRAWVQPGLSNLALSQAAAPHGLTFAPDPSSLKVSTLGGNIAENAGGIHCLGQGTTTDHVLALEWVTPTGEVVWTQSPHAHRAGAGWAWQRLLCGSEGTLGLVTGAWLRLSLLPTHQQVVLASFASLHQAAQAVGQLFRHGLEPAALELMDALTVQCVNRAFGLSLPDSAGSALLLVEVQGHHLHEVASQTQAVATLVNALGATWQATSTTPEDCRQFWQARQGAAASYGLVTPAFYVLDCVVPRQVLAEALAGFSQCAHQQGLTVAYVFHAGDGNVHPHLFFDPADEAQRKAVLLASKAISRLAVALGGVLSGEHGIGLEKRDLMHLQYSPQSLQAMAWVQQTVDPQGLANPCKLLPHASCCGGKHPPEATMALGGWRPEALAKRGLWV